MYFDAKEFGKRLHDVRTSRGITQEELAVRLGLASKQHVSRMENGERSCSIDLLIELSCILHVYTLGCYHPALCRSTWSVFIQTVYQRYPGWTVRGRKN